MGGMQTWLWGEMFPNDMDCLVAIASTPAAISGRNMIWREMISQAIRSDPAWKNGDYPKDSPPKNWIKAVIPLSAIMTGSAEQLQKQAPTRETAIDLVDKLEADGEAYDANDMLYAFESSADYDPAPKLNAIIKPMLTINFADDLTNPPEFLHLPTASNYTEVMIPAGPASYGHMTLAHPAVWASALQSFLQRLPQVRITDSRNFPAATTIAAALVHINPGAMRELHWHPNDEWQYYVSGHGRMTVFASSGKARTFNYQAGDVGYVPHGMAHYVQNLGDEPLVFLELFRAAQFKDVSLNQWMALSPPELVRAHLNLDETTMAALRKEKPIIVR
jgi:oxalate decarboxylase/phosphoglucose isomerase-like protein (cupin superfamily)